MSQSNIVLPGSLTHDRPMAKCVKCERLDDPGSGVELKRGKWFCGACWRRMGMRLVSGNQQTGK